MSSLKENVSSSSSSSPRHTHSSPISFYDPEFTTQISTKMRVPERISAVENGFDDPAIIAAKKQPLGNDGDRGMLWMHVPERILVAGGDNHISGREPLPEMKLENSIHGDNTIPIHLSTPPHTLTLNDHLFPTVEDMGNVNAPKMGKKNRNVALSGLTANDDDLTIINGPIEKDNACSNETPDAYQSYYATNVSSINDASDEMAILKRQVKSLSRRMTALEIDHQHRNQREVVIYTLGVLYFIFKGLFWLNRHW